MKLNDPYNQNTFRDFLFDFLPSDYVELEKDIAAIDKCKVITEAKELGYSKSLGVNVLEMTHNKNSDPRVSIATDAFRILANHGVDKALVIFKNSESENYRFSYLTINLDISDKNKVVRKYSNARRYSFYLGTGAKIKTPEQQLIAKGRVVSVEDLLNRFSLEVVNKQFYLEVAGLFDELVKEEGRMLELPFQSDPNIRKNFAMRLIGRLMFCWFLKQKKSDTTGVPLIPEELLSLEAVKDTYYHFVLEPLFFETLNAQKEDRDIRNDLHDLVPYLNGGLFSPQIEDYYALDRDTSVSKYIGTLKVSDDWFKKFFTLLETYNFTIDENTVFDQELSVDPEMLGRIFENLLAEINPDTGSSDRKRTGSFYTPRQIVEYMVDQSLLEYLKTKTTVPVANLKALITYDINDDEQFPIEEKDRPSVIKAIDSLRVFDPACGSGAFPIGMLQKVVWILQRVDPNCELWLEQRLSTVPELYRQRIINQIRTNPFDYTRKLDVIKNSIFGVDIQPIAVEMSRLRCFLTLIVESEVDDSKPNRNIDPLPNLDFKFVCANTLIPAPESQSTSDGLFSDDFQISLATAVDRYFSSSGANKASANTEIHRLIDAKVDEKMTHLNSLVSYNGDRRMEEARAQINKKEISEHSRVLTLWQSYKNIFENKTVGFFEIKYFFPSVKEGFDIIIGNPPYISHDKITNKREIEIFKTYSPFADLYCYFLEKSMSLLKEQGVVTLIVSNSFIKADYGMKLRQFLGSENTVLQILNIENSQVFESAIVNTAIVQVSKSTNHKHDSRIINSPWNGGTFEQFVKDQSYELDAHYFESAKWSLESEDIQNLIQKIRSTGKSLEERNVFIRLGLATGANEAFLLNRQKLDELISFDPKSKEIIKPVLRGRDIDRYSYDLPDQWLILAKNGVNIEKDYTAIYNHLNSFGEAFKKRGAQGQDWWNLRACSFFDEFLKPKIVWIELSDTNRFSLCNEEIYLLNSAYFLIPPENLSPAYLLGILNSSLMKYFLEKIAATSGMGTLRWINAYVKQFPIVTPTNDKKNLASEIETLVTQILTLKEQNKDADTKDLESQIDQLVFKLYSLTQEEIDIIVKSGQRQ
ncbi:MAG: hypothetical protein A3D17_11355 [Bdellovibrionales bacterium RIFCSPHIGHO2_02_FULL_40_15]|nr:MAG: hypothetical protein A3D17_11355 [Bdellovibrionales bacterium RIFCSPHIGHO2_02_FULL_40_15]